MTGVQTCALPICRLPRFWLPRFWLTSLWLTRLRLTGCGLPRFVHGEFSGLGITSLSGLCRQSPLLRSQFPGAVGQFLQRLGRLGGTRFRLTGFWLTRLGFSRHRLSGFGLTGLTSRWLAGQRQFFTRLLREGLRLPFCLPGQLVQSLGGIGLGLRSLLALVLPEGLFS